MPRGELSARCHGEKPFTSNIGEMQTQLPECMITHEKKMPLYNIHDSKIFYNTVSYKYQVLKKSKVVVSGANQDLNLQAAVNTSGFISAS